MKKLLFLFCLTMTACTDGEGPLPVESTTGELASCHTCDVPTVTSWERRDTSQPLFDLSIQHPWIFVHKSGTGLFRAYGVDALEDRVVFIYESPVSGYSDMVQAYTDHIYLISLPGSDATFGITGTIAKSPTAPPPPLPDGGREVRAALHAVHSAWVASGHAIDTMHSF